MKIFKGLRTTLASTVLANDPKFMLLSENEAFNSLFGAGAEPFEMVLHLNDGSRWKLDSQQNKKLNIIVIPDNIIRFEAIFPPNTNFESQKQAFNQALESMTQVNKDSSLKDLEACLRKLVSVYIIDGEAQSDKCENCKELKGAQKFVELMRLGQYLGI